MQPIALTEEHKSKLLEMCKILFPEYPNLEVRNSMEDFCMEQEDCFIELQESGSNSRKDTIIHWFEFCRYWLFPAINKIRKESWKITAMEFMNCEHPIDYLYEQFLKLK